MMKIDRCDFCLRFAPPWENEVSRVYYLRVEVDQKCIREMHACVDCLRARDILPVPAK